MQEPDTPFPSASRSSTHQDPVVAPEQGFKPIKKEKPKKPPKPGTKAAILLKQQQQQQQEEQLAAQLEPLKFIPPTTTFDPKTGVLVLAFRNVAALTAALGRPHVAYEGGHLKGPLKGVNFPAVHFTEWIFKEAQSDRVTDAERSINSIITGTSTTTLSDTSSPIPPPISTVYICAYIQNDKSTFLHEWAHAVYHTSDTYRALCSSLYAELDAGTVKVVEKELQMRNYRADVYLDEWQAYCVEGPGEFGKKLVKVLMEAHRVLRKEVGLPPGW
ncbi:hypothetical protein DFJ77DRAFT_435376 [Powellomyces hirtus]|nr:hypothetical protein DFJ77DRAFT_435376 [Powellomyces hirtus]